MTKFKPGDRAIYFHYTPKSRNHLGKYEVEILKVHKTKALIRFNDGTERMAYLDNLQAPTKEFVSKQAGSL
jgi:hypothetical protein